MDNISWDEYRDYLLYERNIRNNAANLTSYKSRFISVTTYFKNQLFSKDNIRQFIKHLHESGQKQSTINKYISCIKHLADYLDKPNEVKTLKRSEETVEVYDVLDKEEQQKLIATHPPTDKFVMFPESARQRLEEQYHHRNDVIIETFLKTGMRFGELRNLRWQDWYPVEDAMYGGKLRVMGSKTGKMRWMPVLKDLAEKINSLPRHPHGFIFGCDRGKLDNHTINGEIKRRLATAGISKPCENVRRLRTTCGTTLLRNKAPIERVARKLGNSVEVCYERYYKEIIDDIVEIEYLNPLNATVLKFNIIKLWTRELMGRIKDSAVKINKYQETKHRVILDIADA